MAKTWGLMQWVLGPQASVGADWSDSSVYSTIASTMLCRPLRAVCTMHAKAHLFHSFVRCSLPLFRREQLAMTE